MSDLIQPEQTFENPTLFIDINEQSRIDTAYQSLDASDAPIEAFDVEPVTAEQTFGNEQASPQHDRARKYFRKLVAGGTALTLAASGGSSVAAEAQSPGTPVDTSGSSAALANFRVHSKKYLEKNCKVKTFIIPSRDLMRNHTATGLNMWMTRQSIQVDRGNGVVVRDEAPLFHASWGKKLAFCGLVGQRYDQKELSLTPDSLTITGKKGEATYLSAMQGDPKAVAKVTAYARPIS